MSVFFSRFMGNESQCGTNKLHENRFAVHAICLFRTAIHFPWTKKKRHSFLNCNFSLLWLLWSSPDLIQIKTIITHLGSNPGSLIWNPWTWPLQHLFTNICIVPKINFSLHEMIYGCQFTFMKYLLVFWNHKSRIMMSIFINSNFRFQRSYVMNIFKLQ